MSGHFSSRPRLIALLCVAVLLLAIGIYELTPGQRLKARHDALLEWARSGAPADFEADFAAAGYYDQWGHHAGDVAERVRAARFLHPRLTIEAETPEITRYDRTAMVDQEITIRPCDGETLRHAFRFRWDRESFWPWSWRLSTVEAPGFQF